MQVELFYDQKDTVGSLELVCALLGSSLVVWLNAYVFVLFY